ncbi:MAG: citryl-CoA lyase [Pseudomonadota bacterium]
MDQKSADWWSTEIIEMSPGVIRYRGYAIEELIGNVGFAQMIWLMLRGELPSRPQADLLETALMAAVDHGPQAPSIAISRMAATCGLGLNSAMASAVNVLGDVHGGAGEQALELYSDVADRVADGASLTDAAVQVLEAFRNAGGKYVPGFGHRFHPIDPRAPRLLELTDHAVAAGVVPGHHLQAARELDRQIGEAKGRSIPMNIDGATAVIYGELGFPPPLARGLFCLSRSVGILAHAWEQTEQGGRNKGPMPRDTIWSYTGPAPRPVPRGEP